MYRVLIVEDEMLVRLGLKNLIIWENYNMKIIADVSNGLEAWEVFERESPEVVLTDIKMPVMDGITLIEKIRAKDLNTKIIILSCIEDFEIAIKAISLSVFAYIPKLTMNRTYIESTIIRVRDELNLLYKNNTDQVHKDFSNEEKKLELLKDLTNKSNDNKDELIKRINGTEIRLNEKNLILCLFEIDRNNSLSESILNSIIIDTIKSTVMTQQYGEVIKDINKRYIVILSYPNLIEIDEITKNIDNLVEDVRKLLKNYVGVTVSVGVSSIQNSYLSISEQYQEAIEALLLKFCFGTNKNYYWDKKVNILYQSEIIRRLKNLFETFFKDDLLTATHFENVREKTSQFLEKGFETDSDILKIFFQLMYWHSVELSHFGMDFSIELINFQYKIIDCDTLDELLEVYEKYIAILREVSNKKRFISKDIANSISYIKNNCHKNISLQQVADYVNLSPNYLSSLFKKELEHSFVEYLTIIRIQKAKNLLLETNLKLYEIANSSGFSDEAYFSRTFKKHTGKSPIIFRRQYMLNTSEVADDSNP